jgi:hypothetical protein
MLLVILIISLLINVILWRKYLTNKKDNINLNNKFKKLFHDLKSPLIAIEKIIESFESMPNKDKESLNFSLERVELLVKNFQNENFNHSCDLNSSVNDDYFYLKDFLKIEFKEFKNFRLNIDQWLLLPNKEKEYFFLIKELLIGNNDLLVSVHNMKTCILIEIQNSDNFDITKIKEKFPKVNFVENEKILEIYYPLSINEDDKEISEIVLDFSIPLIVLDDDSGILDLWKKILIKNNFDVHKIYFCQDISQAEKLIVDLQNVNIISDWYLANFEDGLQFLEKFSYLKFRYLITSHALDQDIRTQCQLRKIVLLDKGKIDFYKICHLVQDEYVLIDDDELITFLWLKEAKEKGKKLKVYNSFEKFLIEANQIDPNTHIYIDSDLGHEEKGEILAFKIAQLGFSNLHLATGYDLSNFNLADFPYLKSIQSKYPPF